MQGDDQKPLGSLELVNRQPYPLFQEVAKLSSIFTEDLASSILVYKCRGRTRQGNVG